MSRPQRIFVYEFVTGGGLLAEAKPPSGSLLREGQAMLMAVLRDLRSIDNVAVATTRDYRVRGSAGLPSSTDWVKTPDEELRRFRHYASKADWTLVIAPEFDQILLDRAKLVIEVGGRLLGPSPNFIRIAADKIATAKKLSEAGLPTPATARISKARSRFASVRGPFVIKRVDGAGSIDMSLVESLDKLPSDHTDDFCVQPIAKGICCSVSVLAGPDSTHVPLPASRQIISEDGRFRYLGGELPLPQEMNVRAQRLAVNAIAAIGWPFGYIGVDMILSPDGKSDLIIDVNPRLTTSYVGLRELAQTNLAAAMLAIASGDDAELHWSSHPVRFHADGRLSK